jgi:hypothetical protein
MQTTSRVPPKRNPETQKLYRQQFLLQILLPVLLFSVLLLGLGVLASVSGTQGGINHTAVWAHISTIFMVIFIFIAGLVALAILILGIYALAWLLSRLPEYSYIAQLYLQLFGRHIHTLADKSTTPFILIRTIWTGMWSIFNRKQSRGNITGEE